MSISVIISSYYFMTNSMNNEQHGTLGSASYYLKYDYQKQQDDAGENAHSDESYTLCLEETLLNLPIGRGPHHKRKGLPNDQLLVWAHHFDARNGKKWNEQIRFEDLDNFLQKTDMKEGAVEVGSGTNNQAPCKVWEIGAHTAAYDSSVLMEKYPQCEYHAYEPIPLYFNTLMKNWNGTKNMHLHNYGISKDDGSFNVSSSVLKGQSTFIGDSKQANVNTGDISTVVIKNFDFAVNDAGGKPTLLHMNCEGCEWTLLPGAVESGFIKDIPIIQISFHNYGESGLGQRVIDYCTIRAMLSQTHNRTKGVPFAWERWERVE